MGVQAVFDPVAVVRAGQQAQALEFEDETADGGVCGAAELFFQPLGGEFLAAIGGEYELPELALFLGHVAAPQGLVEGLQRLGLGLALKKPLIHVPTVDALAYNLWGAKDLVCPIMDARRGQVYTGIYRFQDGEHLTVVEDQMAVSIEELGEKLKAYKEEVTFLGDGVPVFREVLETQIMKGEKIRFAPANMNRQRAASVGALGLIYYKEGKTQTAEEHKPDYLRVSQAERERKERMEHDTVSM